MSVTCLVHDLAALCKTFHSEAASGSDVQLPLEQFPQWVYGRKKLEVMHQAGYQDTPLPDLHDIVLVLLYGCETSQSFSALALMHLTCGHYERFRGYHTPAM